MSGNGASVLRGGYGVLKDGKMNFEDGVQILGGGLGLGGGWLGRMSNAADGAKPIDDLVEAADNVVPSSNRTGSPLLQILDNGGCFLGGTFVHIPIRSNAPSVGSSVSQNDDKHDHHVVWYVIAGLSLLIAIQTLKEQTGERKKKAVVRLATELPVRPLDELFSSEMFWESGGVVA